MFRKMRRKKQEISHEECLPILKAERRGVLSVMGDEGYPYAIPMNFYYEEKEEKIYFHCAAEGHKIDAVKKCNKGCFTTWNRGYKEEGDWAFHVTSVIAFGKMKIIDDRSVVMEKLRRLALKYYPTKEEAEEEISKNGAGPQMIVFHIEHLTGKRVKEK